MWINERSLGGDQLNPVAKQLVLRYI